MRWWIGLVLFLGGLDAQTAEHWEFRLFPNPDGVPLAEVSDICEDRDGAIWIVTWGEGIHRIHGTEWKHFTKADGLPDDWVRSVTSSRDGGVWVGTRKGLARIQEDSMEVLSPDNFPLFLEEDVYFVKELSNAQLWVGTTDGRILVREPGVGSKSDIRLGWKVIMEPGDTGGEKIHQIVEVEPNTLLISVERQRLFGVRNGVVERDPFQGSTDWYSIFKEERTEGAVLWAIARSGEGVYRYEDGAWLAQPHEISGVNEMTQSDSGRLYAATSTGFYALHEGGWNMLEMPRNIGTPRIKCVAIDRNGVVWLGGKEGLIRGVLMSWNPLPSVPEKPSPSLILSRSSPKSPHLAINFNGDVFQAIEGDWKPILRLHPWDSQQLILNNQTWSDNSEFWPGNEYRGLWLSLAQDRIYTIQNSALSVYSLEDGSRMAYKELVPQTPRSNQYFITSDEQIWTLRGDGVYRYADGTWLPFPDDPNYKHRRAYVIVETEPGVFYAGLQDGIERWTKTGVEYFGEAHGINTEDFVHTICPTPSGDIWFGSYGSGVYRYDGATFHQMNKTEGLQSHSVRNIFAASNGVVWIAYRRTGLSKYVDGRWINYSLKHGLPNAAILNFAEEPGGHIWIGSQNQRLYQHIPDKESPETYISIGPDQVDAHGIAIFSFSAWDAWNQTRVRDLCYSWRIIPLQANTIAESAWSPLQPGTLVVTEPLARGAYRFEVRGVDENGNMDSTPAEVTFSVAPPFWKKPLFYIPLLCSIALATIALLFRSFSHRALLLSEAALQEANERLRLKNVERERLLMAIEQAAETIIITDTDGTIQYVNPAFEHITGYTREEIIGQNSRTIRSGKHDDAFYAEILDKLERGETWSGRIIDKKKDGTLFAEEMTVSPVHDASGKQISHVAIKRDITRESELESQLRQAQKMEAVGQLAGGIAHDFNNLLQAILGFGEIALEETETDSLVHTSVGEMLKAGHRAAALTRQLLAFSRRQVLDMKDIDLNDIAENLIKMLRRVIGEHITLDVITSHDLGVVRADPGQIEQILINLCVNARDAMPTGGTITIETQNTRIDETFCETHSWAAPGYYALLSVTDTGCGMDKKIIANAFEPFFTTKGVGEGTGLGLSTVYGLIKQHHGMIHIYSEVGEGTTIKIYLPLVERSDTSADNNMESPVRGGTETILLAEDESSIRELSQGILEKAGYTVLTACDGEEALQIFLDQPDKIDLLLLDVMMPKRSGRAVFEHAQKICPEIRVLFSSGYSMNAIHTSFVLDKNLLLIQKPYQRDELLRRVRETLDNN